MPITTRAVKNSYDGAKIIRQAKYDAVRKSVERLRARIFVADAERGDLVAQVGPHSPLH
jgi:hypothetical protein